MPDHDSAEQIAQVVRSISTLMVKQQVIGLDFADLRLVLERQEHDGAGRSSFAGQGEASGERRAARAAELAIDAIRRSIAHGR